MKEKKRKLTVIIFTDIVGYSRLSHRNEALALSLLQEHRELVRGVFPQYGGTEIKTIGDAFLLSFPNVFDAVRCALHIQRALSKRNQQFDSSRHVHVRIGIHLGDVVITGDGDVYGDGVNIASRIVHLAGAGEVCVSSPVYQQIRNKSHLRGTALGKQKLKNISEKVSVYRISLRTAEGPIDHFRVQAKRFKSFALRVVPYFALALCLVTIVGIRDVKHPKAALEPALDTRRIALIPFKKVGLEKNEEYLPEGMTEDLISTLSKVHDIHVIAQSTVAAYKDKNLSPKKLGQELNVSVLLVGTIKKIAGRFHIVSQLIDTKSEEYLWSQEYDGALDDVLQIQKRISQGVAEKLEGRALASLEMPEVESNSNSAYINYLKGRFFFNRRGEEDLRLAARYFDQALLLDPKFVLAYTSLANTYDLLSFYGFMSPEEAHTKGLEAVEKAIVLDPDTVDSHVFLAEMAEEFENDWGKSEREFKKALALRPDYGTLHSWYSDFLIAVGDFNHARKEVALALEIEPKSPTINISQGRPEYYAGNYLEAIRRYQAALSVDPTYQVAYYWLAAAYIKAGQSNSAIQILKPAIAFSATPPPMMQAMLGCAYAQAGKKKDAYRILEELKKTSKTRYVSQYFLAEISASMGDSKKAVQYLYAAQKEHAYHLIFVAVDPLFKGLHGNKEFDALVDRVGALKYLKDASPQKM